MSLNSRSAATHRISSLWGLAFWTSRSQPAIVAGIGLSLLLLAVSQAAAIILVKAFLVVFFGPGAGAVGSDPVIPISRLLPVASPGLANSSWLPEGAGAVVHQLLALVVPLNALYIGIPLAVLVAGFLKAIASYTYNRLQQDFSLLAGASLRDNLFTAILHKPWTELAQTSPAGWMSVVVNDVAFVQTRLSEFMSCFLRGGVAVFASLATMAIIHWPSAVVLVLLMPLAARATGRTGKKIAGFSSAVQGAMRVMSSLVLEVRGRFDFMRVQRGEPFDCHRFREINESWFATISRSILVRSAFAPALEFAGFAIFAAFVFALDRQWLGNAADASAVDFALQFVVALGFMVKPLREIGEQLSRYHETRGAIRACLGMISAPPSLPVESTIAAPNLGVAGEISVRAVSFAWSRHLTEIAPKDAVPAPGFEFKADGGKGPAALRILPGRTIAVVGPSGSGKSSMLKVFSGMVGPDFWDANVAWQDLAVSTALVPQQPYLFAASIRENICYGSDDAADGKIRDTLSMMDLQDLIHSLPEGIETPVSSLAANLSGGQIQRLVIARALLREKPLLLLDEATSALDPATEVAVLQKVVSAVRASRRALVAVTHRMQCLGLFDEVWFVEGGRISLCGTREQLMAEPRFREFCQVQS